MHLYGWFQASVSNKLRDTDVMIEWAFVAAIYRLPVLYVVNVKLQS